MWAIAFNLFYLVLAIMAVFAALRLRDRLLGVKFSENILPKIKQQPIALAIFFGAWVLGACHLAGRMLGVG